MDVGLTRGAVDTPTVVAMVGYFWRGLDPSFLICSNSRKPIDGRQSLIDGISVSMDDPNIKDGATFNKSIADSGEFQLKTETTGRQV